MNLGPRAKGPLGLKAVGRIIAIREKNVQRLEGEYTNNNPSTSARDKEFAFPVFTILYNY